MSGVGHQRVLLRVKRSRPTGDAPATVAVPMARGADGALESVVIFDLVKAQRNGNRGSTVDALERQLDRLELEAVAPHRPQPRAELRRVVASNNRAVVLIDVEQQEAEDNVPFIGNRAKKRMQRIETDPSPSSGGADADTNSSWDLYEARRPAAGPAVPASATAPIPSIDEEWVRRADRARREHLDLLENFSQRLDPSSLMREAWSILDVPFDSPFDVTESTDEMKRLVFDAGDYEYGLPEDDDGTYATYRRARRHLFESRCAAALGYKDLDLDEASTLVVKKGTAVELAAYGGDDYDSNAESNSTNEYPSTQDGEDAAEDRGESEADDNDRSDDQPRFGVKFRRPATRTPDEDDDDDGDDRDEDDEADEKDSWGVGTGPQPYKLIAKIPAAPAAATKKVLDADGWGDSDDDVRVATRRFDECYGDDSDDGFDHGGRRRKAGDDDHETYAPEVYYDPEGNAYW